MKEEVCIEVYCGKKSFTIVAVDFFRKTFTIDFNGKFKPDLECDMLYFKKNMLPKEFRKPFFMWFSPPCETFSLSGNSRFMGVETNSKAYIGLALAYKCIELIRELKPKYWVIENPLAGLKNVWFMKPLPYTEVTYCQYGFPNMKPTILFNNFGFQGRKCKNGDSCHVSAPRGSKTGTQGEKSKEIRGKIPPLLIQEILEFLQRKQWDK